MILKVPLLALASCPLALAAEAAPPNVSMEIGGRLLVSADEMITAR